MKSTNHQQINMPFNIIKLNDAGLYGVSQSTKLVNKANPEWGEWTIVEVIDDESIVIKNNRGSKVLDLSEASEWEVGV